MTAAPRSWVTLTAGVPLTTGRLRFDFAGAGAGTIPVLSEIEIWGAGARTPIKSGADLDAAMSGPTPPLQGRRYAATPATGTIGALPDETPDDPADNSFHFSVDRSPRDFRRAWIVYETVGVGHWVAAARSINHHATLGGIALTPGQDWSTQIEEIDPDWLQAGDNSVDFEAPDGSETKFGVRNLRCVAEMEDGSNFLKDIAFGRSSRNPTQDADTDTKSSTNKSRISSTVTNLITLTFDKPAQVEALILNVVGSARGPVGVSWLVDGAWLNSGPTIAGTNLAIGTRQVATPSLVPVDGVRLSFPSSPDVVPIGDVVPLGSGVGARWAPGRLHLTYPDAGQFTGREAYLRGFVTPADNGSGPARITIGSAVIDQDAGAFEAIVSKDDAGFASLADAAPWFVDVKAAYPDGQTVSARVTLDHSIAAPESSAAYLLPTRSFPVAAGRARALNHDGLSLQIGADSVLADTTLKITPLPDTDLAALDQGMVNVTRGPRRGYRLQPHGTRFRTPIQISVPYDRGLIPPGLGEDDIRTFYFDDQAGHWKELDRVAVDTTGNKVVSLTDHFTDIINATVTVPDHPQPLAYNPTEIKDIKVADPGAGIDLIEPPRPNSQGDARLSYPIQIPPGRGGIQPRLEVTYDSSHGNGWMGVGWDLRMPALTIDTRWGVPYYDGTLETESYTLEGDQLTPLANRGALVARVTDRTYHTRVEQSFRKVVRHGAHPYDYWWEITDKSGTRFIYGGDPDLNMPSGDAILADPGSSGNIFQWMLREVQDTHGNTMRYHYDVVDGGNGGEPWRQVYLKSIRYTGSGNVEGPYEIVFLREGSRHDVAVDGRPGFKTVLEDRLKSVEVRLLTEANPLIRRYTFDYADGPFSKTLLTRVTEYGEDGVTEFNHHSFDYFDEVSGETADVINGFGNTVNITGAHTVQGDTLLFDKTSAAFNADEAAAEQIHFYGGIALGYQKEVSGGVKVGADFENSTSKMALLDLNGDGLPDQVYQDGSNFSYRPNTGGPSASPNFGTKVALPSLSDIGHENSQTFTLGAEGFAYGVNGLLDVSFTQTGATSYMSDVNGDGLPDVVIGTDVFFNHLVGGVPTFGSSSPTPVASGAPSDASGMVIDPQKGKSDMESTYHLVDPLRRWNAPYSGTIAITGQVQLAGAPPASYKTADGVRVSIQHDGAEIWTTTIGDPNDLAPRTITGLGSVSVSAGDDIYFRVHSINDGSYDAVVFDPTITYVAGVPSETDENGMPIDVYSASSDYSYGGRALPWATPFDGTANLSGDLIKPAATTDDVAVEVQQNGLVVYRTTFGAAQTGAFHISVNLVTVAQQQIQVRLDTDSRIDLSHIRFAPILTFQTINGQPAPKDGNGNPLLYFYPPVAAQIYPQNASASPYDPIIAPFDGDICVRQTVSMLALTPPDYVTNVTLAVKSPGVLLAKQRIDVRAGVIVGTDTLAATFSVHAGDGLYFTADATAPDSLLHVSIGPPNVTYVPPGSCGAGVDLPYDVHVGLDYKEAFGGGFRRWSFGQYNGRDGAIAIDESRLRLPANDSDTATKDFVQMVPFPHEDYWRAEDKDCWIGAVKMSASRLMVKHLAFPDGSSFGGGRGVQRYGGGFNAAAGISALSFGAGASHGNNWSDVDFLDFNGDRYPDVVGNGAVQTTLPNGALGAMRFSVGGFGHVRESTADSFNVTLGATTSTERSNAEGRLQAISTEQSAYNLNIGVTGSRGHYDTGSDLVDINGDNLPDSVRKTDDGLKVRLNLGYRFGVEETWGGSTTLRVEKTQSHGISAGVGATLPAYSYGGGFADTQSDAAAEQDLVDMNGDGLVDIVRKDLSDDVESSGTDLSVRFNTGNGFTGEKTFRGALPQPVHGNQRVSRNLGLHFTIPIPIPFTPISIILNPGFYGGESLGGAEVVLSDFDGDGYADHVYSDTSGAVQVRLNAHDRTNLLKHVSRPLGATIDLDYARSGDTSDQPGNRWVLAKSTVFDGYVGDGADQQLTTFVYGDGKYDRGEREFYGFHTVTEEIRNPAAGNALYRSIVRTYGNSSYYDKGLLLRELTRDDLGRSFLETVNTYSPIDLADGAAVLGLEDFTTTRFPALAQVDRLFYEGQALPGKTTQSTYEYDALGNVTRFTDSGDPGPQDDVDAQITYFHDDPNYIVGKADGITVRGNGVIMRQRTGILETGTGNLVQVRQRLESGQEAVTDLVYSSSGNLLSVTGPANLHGQRLTLTYEYDPVVDTHITAVQDSMGYRSTATYKTKYGQLDLSVDTNDQPTERLYDMFGRVSTIFGPYEFGGATPTLAFDYHPEAAVPYAVTKHVDEFRDINDPIETIQFSDGLKRAIQTKQDSTVHVGPSDPNPPQVMTVSGRLTFDHVGRTIESYYPVTEAKGPANVNFNAAYDTIAPTRTQLDVLDRTRRVTIPDNTFTTTSYSFGTDRDGSTQFETLFTDARGVPKRTYRNVRDLITGVRESNKGGTQTIWTSFVHDPLKNLIRVVDDHNNTTRLAYDNLGRRIVVDSPDSGKTEMRYDLAGNSIAKITANLRGMGLQIGSDYEFTRLKSITYPSFPENNVTYTYGAPGASDNRANRLVTISDESGTEERFYGRLGEIVKSTRTVASDTQGTSANSPEVYTTQYVYDTWGRLQSLTYPDTEVVTYRYDAGGRVRAVSGVKAGTTYQYVNRLEYDKFDDRAFALYGNGAQTIYTHDAKNRRLAALQSVSGLGTPFQNLQYGYDAGGNVLSIANVVPVPPASQFGGPTSQSFVYDDLSRLTAAGGTYQFAPNKTRKYAAQMDYDSIHNILSKGQSDAIIEPSGVSVPQHKTSYTFGYQYGPDGGARPHAPLHIGDLAYTYDADGNQTGWTNDRNGTRRTIVWDEENRIQSVADNGHVKTYKYDEAGDRVIKRGQQGETVYVNPYFSVRNRSVATKHVWIGTTRMVSKLVSQENKSISGSPTSPPIEKDVYFYHGDQVGSSNFVTDAGGNLYEHLEYFPSGESWVEESTNTQRTPYLFTGKELDEETGLYDFGARYYDPRTSVWQSADPALGELLAKNADLQRVPRRLAMYAYALQNPLIHTDPDGRDPLDDAINDPNAFKLTQPWLIAPPQRGIRILPPATLTPPTLTIPSATPSTTIVVPSTTGATSLVPPLGSLDPKVSPGPDFRATERFGTIPGDAFKAYLDRGVPLASRDLDAVGQIYQNNLRFVQNIPDPRPFLPSFARGWVPSNFREKLANTFTNMAVDNAIKLDYPTAIERFDRSISNETGGQGATKFQITVFSTNF